MQIPAIVEFKCTVSVPVPALRILDVLVWIQIRGSMLDKRIWIRILILVIDLQAANRKLI
jgi:hypothetical protein